MQPRQSYERLQGLLHIKCKSRALPHVELDAVQDGRLDDGSSDAAVDDVNDDASGAGDESDGSLSDAAAVAECLQSI